MWLVDKRLGMVAAKLKDYKILQNISTVIKNCHTEEKRRVGSEVKKVTCPLNIAKYHRHIGGIDRGDQHQVMGASFNNVAYFRNGIRRHSWVW